MNKLDLIRKYIRKREQEKYEKQRERVRELFKKARIEEERNMIKAGKIRQTIDLEKEKE